MLLDSLAWLLYWFMGWTLFHVPSLGFDYFRRPAQTFHLFLFLSLPLLIVLVNRHRDRISQLETYDWLLIALFFLGVLLVYRLSHLMRGRRIEELRRLDMDIFLDHRFLFTKLSDILFQQCVILLVVFSLGIRDVFIAATIVSIMFGIAHLPSIFINRTRDSAFFTMMSVAAGFIFTFLILSWGKGYLFSYLLHFLFYVAWALYPVWVGGHEDRLAKSPLTGGKRRSRNAASV